MTTETGDYSFTLLPVATYEIKTELAGFKTQTAKVQLATGDRARVDVKLELGTVSETLTVSGEAPLLQTDSSRVSSRLTNEIVQNAPIQGRNIVNMLQLTPGASEGQANATISGNRPDDRRPSSAVSINGNPENDNLHLVDGLDNIERVKSGMGIKLSLEAIQEVRRADQSLLGGERPDPRWRGQHHHEVRRQSVPRVGVLLLPEPAFRLEEFLCQLQAAQ